MSLAARLGWLIMAEGINVGSARERIGSTAARLADVILLAHADAEVAGRVVTGADFEARVGSVYEQPVTAQVVGAYVQAVVALTCGAAAGDVLPLILEATTKAWAVELLAAVRFVDAVVDVAAGHIGVDRSEFLRRAIESYEEGPADV
jgi:hypothetical protein